MSEGGKVRRIQPGDPMEMKLAFVSGANVESVRATFVHEDSGARLILQTDPDRYWPAVEVKSPRRGALHQKSGSDARDGG